MSENNNNSGTRSDAVPTTELQIERIGPDPHVVAGVSIYGTRYTRAFKLQVLKDADACAEPGDIGRMLRRHGVTHTTLTSFRRQRASGALSPARTGGPLRLNA